MRWTWFFPAEITFIDPRPDQKNALLFFKYPQLRRSEYLTFDQRGRIYLFNEIMNERSNDSVSLMMRGQINPAQQKILDELDRIVAQGEEQLWPRFEYRLETPLLRALIVNQQLTIEQAMRCEFINDIEHNELLIRALLISKLIAWEQMPDCINRVSSIRDGELSLLDIILMNNNQLRRLTDRCIREGILDQRWTVNQAMNFTEAELDAVFNLNDRVWRF